MSHYLTRYCDEHGEYEADVNGDQECEECRSQGKLPYQLDKQRIAVLESEVAALRAEVEAAREMREALQALHDDNMDYLTRNKLGGENNHCMKWARKAIAHFDLAREESSK